MSYEKYTVDQLIEATTDLNDRVDTLFDHLGRIESTARGEGIEATVNLEGRLVGLTLSPETAELPPETLAAEIFRLTQEASAAALTEGLAALAPVAGEELTAELADLIGTRPQAAPPPEPSPRPRTLDDSRDFSEIESWAVPR